MTPATAARLVLVSTLGMAAITLAASRGRPHERTFRALWAIGVLSLGLGIAADVVPQVAGPFALLVLVAFAARNAGTLGAVLPGGTATAGPPRAGAGARATSTRESARTQEVRTR